MVLESQGEYDSQWAAICSIAPKIGCTPKTLRVWVRQHEWDTGGGDGGLTTAERQRLKELERENRELSRIVYGNDIRAGCSGAGVMGPSTVRHSPSQ
ncbi:transposase [Escherichia coli]|uniref:transposase n=1 Tax=Escherichia coli TaxID=562 RepID=UPI0003FB6A03